MGDFKMSPAELRDAAPLFSTTADDVRRAGWHLQDKLDGLGDICGGDEQGRAYATVYQPRVDQLLAMLSKTSHGLATIDGGVKAMADNHSRTDAHHAGQFDGLRGPR